MVCDHCFAWEASWSKSNHLHHAFLFDYCNNPTTAALSPELVNCMVRDIELCDVSACSSSSIPSFDLLSIHSREKKKKKKRAFPFSSFQTGLQKTTSDGNIIRHGEITLVSPFLLLSIRKRRQGKGSQRGEPSTRAELAIRCLQWFEILSVFNWSKQSNSGISLSFSSILTGHRSFAPAKW